MKARRYIGTIVTWVRGGTTTETSEREIWAYSAEDAAFQLDRDCRLGVHGARGTGSPRGDYGPLASVGTVRPADVPEGS